MASVKAASSSKRTSTVVKQRSSKSKRREKIICAQIYPMMPRGYTAAQRAELRKFERELYAGCKVIVE